MFCHPTIPRIEVQKVAFQLMRGMSAFDPKRTSLVAPPISAFEGKADMDYCSASVRFSPKADITLARLAACNYAAKSVCAYLLRAHKLSART
jgi:hypothetical protein